MHIAPRRRVAGRTVVLDRALERLPIFRLSDSADAAAISLATEGGGRWRVLPSPGDRLPGTFDQDVYVELLHRFNEAGSPADGALSFTLHAFLRAIGRKVDGRNYELLRTSLCRLERTTLESQGAYESPGTRADDADRSRFSILSSVVIERRRAAERSQLPLFPDMAGGEPGDVRATVGQAIRSNLAAGRTSTLVLGKYLALGSPVARRLYRFISASVEPGVGVYGISLERLAELLPLAQRYPSHLLRVLHPAHDQLAEAGIVQRAVTRQDGRSWWLTYELAGSGSGDEYVSV